MFGRRKVAALVAEFLGAGVLTLAVLSVQRSTIGVPYFVALGAGLTAAILMYAFASVSGAHANPAITLGLWTARKIGTLTALLYVVAQLLGGWAAYGIYTYFVKNSLQAIGGNFDWRIMIAEAIGAFVLALGWGVVSFRSNQSDGTKAAVVGGAFALAIIIAAAAGIGVVNPAVALGIRAWDIWGPMGWGTYVLGPVVGAVLGINLYGLLFAPAGLTTETVVVEEVVVAESAVATPSVSAASKKAAAKKAPTKVVTTKKTTTVKKAPAKKPTTKKK